jgi:ribose-phosphate pyrophosphokinase
MILSEESNMKVFCGNASRKLAEAIAVELGIKLGDSEVSHFSDGEIKIDINETVRGSHVFVIQSTCGPVNENLMELLIMIDALKRASAGNITAVIPYYGYSRQDRKTRAREPISAKLVADLLTVAGVSRILTMDLHVDQIQGFFNIPVDHLLGVPSVLAPYYTKKFKDNKDEVIVVSPDLGSVRRARSLAEELEVPLAIIDKRRPKANVSEIMNIIGDVKGKIVVLADDLIDTAGTIVNGANALVEQGAREVYACCTHGVLSGQAIQRIKNSPIKELVVLDTIELPDEKKLDKIETLSIAPVFAEAIRRIYKNISVSHIFNQYAD